MKFSILNFFTFSFFLCVGLIIRENSQVAVWLYKIVHAFHAFFPLFCSLPLSRCSSATLSFPLLLAAMIRIVALLALLLILLLVGTFLIVEHFILLKVPIPAEKLEDANYRGAQFFNDVTSDPLECLLLITMAREQFTHISEHWATATTAENDASILESINFLLTYEIRPNLNQHHCEHGWLNVELLHIQDLLEHSSSFVDGELGQTRQQQSFHNCCFSNLVRKAPRQTYKGK